MGEPLNARAVLRSSVPCIPPMSTEYLLRLDMRAIERGGRIDRGEVWVVYSARGEPSVGGDEEVAKRDLGVRAEADGGGDAERSGVERATVVRVVSNDVADRGETWRRGNEVHL